MSKKELVNIVYQYMNKKLKKTQLNKMPLEALEYYYEEIILPDIFISNAGGI
jgi:hypothetical protein